MRDTSNYSRRNKNKHKIRLGILKYITNKTFSHTSKVFVGHDLNTFGTVGKGINQFDKSDAYQKARKATYIAKKKNPNMTPEEMSNYHYNIRIKDDINNGAIKFGWLKSFFRKLK